MVAYNFKLQFAPLVEAGNKLQTIRAERRTRHAIPGEAIQLYTGMRTKACRKLLTPDPICLEVTPIGIAETSTVIVGHGSNMQKLDAAAVEALALEDGFESTDEFLNFFRTVHGLPFVGVLIKWKVV